MQLREVLAFALRTVADSGAAECGLRCICYYCTALIACFHYYLPCVTLIISSSTARAAAHPPTFLPVILIIIANRDANIDLVC